jgi:hypothetical protein
LHAVIFHLKNLICPIVIVCFKAFPFFFCIIQVVIYKNKAGTFIILDHHINNLEILLGEDNRQLSYILDNYFSQLTPFVDIPVDGSTETVQCITKN